jgi:hypothetical protein
MTVLCWRNHTVTYKKGDRVEKVLEWRRKRKFSDAVPGHLCPTCVANKRLYQPFTEDEY